MLLVLTKSVIFSFLCLTTLLITEVVSDNKMNKSSSNNGDVVTFEEMLNLIKDNHTLIIDVREPQELQETGKIPNSINIPLGIIEEVLQNLSPSDFKNTYGRNKPSKSEPIVFTCRSGNRSGKAQKIAQDLGYTNVKNYGGGWLEWEKKYKV